MKKTILFLLFGLVIVFNCVSVPLPERYVVAPDPDNPFQGTWVYMQSERRQGNGILVIQGNRATTHSIRQNGLLSRWTEGNSYIFDTNNDNPNELRIDDNRYYRLDGESLFLMDGARIVSRYVRYNGNFNGA